MNTLHLHPESILIEAGRPARQPGAPLNQPIELVSTFHAGGDRAYAREGNASSAAFEAAIGALEGGHAIAFSSGMAATSAVVDGLPAGATVIAPTVFYNYHRTYFDELVALGKLNVRIVDITDTDATIAVLGGAHLLWLEVPSNPMLTVADVPALTAAARDQGVLSVVDSTIATPLGIRPIQHGADLVMHSATKWISGHSDLVMGVLVAADEQRAAQLRTRRNLTGALPGSLESYLALRGVRTLSVRLERACSNAAVLAARLAEHPVVGFAHYLGNSDHPQADRVASLLDHHGALVSFTVDSVARADKLCASVRLITHATSLGGVESLIERRGAYPGELKQGTPAELVRLSVGIEHVEDLWADLEQAMT
jgi:cystathionine gamma-synthase